MKKPQLFSIILLTWILFLMSTSFVMAKEKPSYVGINENDVIIWKTAFDQGPFENALEDGGLSEEQVEVAMETDLFYSSLFTDETDEDVEGWKYVISEIKDEREYDKEDDYPKLEDDEYNGVPYLYTLYTTENFEAGDWKIEDRIERDVIYRYDRDLYVEIIKDNDHGPMWGLYDRIISKGVNWQRVVDEVDESFDHGYVESGASRSEETILFFVEQEADGISTFFDSGEQTGNDDVGVFESKSIYNDNGILKYYEWTYEGDSMYLIELQENFFIANFWIILIVAAVAIVIIVVVVILRKRR